MSIDVMILIGVVGLALTAAGYFGGRSSNATKDGEWRGKVQTTIEGNTRDIASLRETIHAGNNDIKSLIRDGNERTEESIKRIHCILDDHGKRIATTERKYSTERN